MSARPLLVVFLLSLSLLSLEMAWTRLFSAEFFYSFAFLILSLAILGLGLGALILRLLPGLAREGFVGVSLMAAAAAAVAGPPLVFGLGLDFSRLASEPAMVLRFLGAVALLGSTYVFGGFALALLFRRHHPEMPRLYQADLLGAGLGVVLVLWLMNDVGTPEATVLTAVPLLLAAFLAIRSRWRWVAVPALLGVVALVPRAPALLESQGPERAPVIYKHWDAMAKVKVYDFGGQYRGLNVDNVANSPLIPFDGNWDSPELKEAEWGIDVSYLIGLFDGCRFLSLGAGGGGDVLQALAEGAAEVHAVEVNPHINRMLLEGDPDGYLETPVMNVKVPEGREPPPIPVIRDEAGELITSDRYTGHLYRDPRVRVVSEDARTYVRRHPGAFDLIFSLSSNTWAALGSGSFAFAESYLFTKEAFRDYWRALSDDGFLSMEHQVYMPRLVSALMEALAEEGVREPTRHFAVYDLPRMRRNLLLVSRRPLTAEIRNRAYGELTPERFDDIHLLFPPHESVRGQLIDRIVTEGWSAVADEAPVNISPSTDDRPFVAQMGLWRNFDREVLSKLNGFAEFRGFPVSTLIILVVLAVTTVLVLPLNLLPYLGKGPRLRPVPWLYFFAIGVAFMAAEIVLMQKYALFIGASVYSIATVLLTLLVAAGVGSRYATRVKGRWVFGGIALGLVLHAFAAGWLTDALASLPLVARIALSAALVAPVGFLMGIPFPKAALRVGPLVDWGFAVNGAASVVGGTAVLLVAFNAGFAVALSLAAVLYLGAGALLGWQRTWA
jgi:hypothetical protein